MSETQDVKVIDDVENVENKIKSIGLNNNEEKKLQKCASIDSYKDTAGTIDPVVKPVIEDKNKVGVKDQVPVDESSRQNSIDGVKNVGECRNILPVLVENLCSSFGTINDVSDEPLAPDPTSSSSSSNQPTTINQANSSHETHQIISQNQQKNIDLNYLQDLSPSDIKAAIVRLEETLKGVDVDALSSNTELQPSEKSNLLNLIQNLVSNLKKVKLTEIKNDNPPVSVINPVRRGRHRNNRHTIGVSSEELASARKWLEQERGESIKFSSENRSSIHQENSQEIPAISPVTVPPIAASVSAQPSVPQSPQISPENYKFVNSIPSVVRSCDKHIKDAINQQQSLSHRTKDSDFNFEQTDHERCTIDQPIQQIDTLSNLALNQQPSNPLNRSNKFFAKKSKIKRANTIDIPNYLKMQEEKKRNSLNGYSDVGNKLSGLRKPIDISDKMSWNYYSSHQTISPAPVPNFEPKTENDRKFLALINKNNSNTGNSGSSEVNWNVNPTNNQAYKTFSYRQTSSTADKNWKSRFSNIKTAFDQQSLPTSPSSLPPTSSRRSSRDHDTVEPIIQKNGEKTPDKSPDRTTKFGKFENLQDSNHTFLPSYHHPGNIGSKLPIFTHAATSPFKKISNPSPKYPEGHQKVNKIMEKPVEKPILSSFLPNCATNGLLKAKVKIFDHQNQPSQIPKATVTNYSRKSYPERSENRIIPSKQQDQQKIYRKKDKNYGHYRSNGHFCGDENDEDGDDEEEEFKIVGKYPKKISIQQQQQNVQSVAVQTNTCVFPSKININDVTYPKKLSYSYGAKPEEKAFYMENENPIYIPPQNLNNHHDENYVEPELNIDRLEDKTFEKIYMPVVEVDKMIENQDISPNKIVTRYTSAIGTLTSTNGLESAAPSNNYPTMNKIPESSFRAGPIPNGSQNGYQRSSNWREVVGDSYRVTYPLANGREDSDQKYRPAYSMVNVQEEIPQSYRPIYPVGNIKEQVYTSFKQPYVQENVQRHNLLQQNLIRRLQERSDEESSSPLSPPTIEANNTQDKINIFEEKSQLIAIPLPKINVINVISPTRVLTQPSFPIQQATIPENSIKTKATPIDSSDEYLVSCANRPNRSIVLSKSESWHQLALLNKPQAVQYLQVPAQNNNKPPKSNSQFRLSKDLDNNQGILKKMEEKVMRYFNNNSRTNSTTSLDCQDNDLTRTTIINKRDKKNKRTFTSSKNSNALVRSQTMPHIFDDNLDVDEAFDSLFEEATRDNNRH